MDWYTIFKFLHVASAVIWIGGALIMVIFGVKADRARDEAELVRVIRQVAWAADRIYVPASMATLIFGLIMAWLGSLWSTLWIILGLVGVVATIATGVLALSPRAKKVEVAFKTDGASSQVVGISREILTIAKFDMVVLFVVVADMVLKPAVSDWITLAVMALAIVAAGAVWLTPVLRKSAA